MEIPQGFDKYFEEDYVLLLLNTLYGSKNEAYVFWCKIMKAFKSMDCKRSKAEPYMYFKWIICGMLI